MKRILLGLVFPLLCAHYTYAIDVTYDAKNAGAKFTYGDANEIKAAVNSKADSTELATAQDEIDLNTAKLAGIAENATTDQDLSGLEDKLICDDEQLKEYDTGTSAWICIDKPSGTITIVQTTDGESTTSVPSEDAVGTALDGKASNKANNQVLDFVFSSTDLATAVSSPRTKKRYKIWADVPFYYGVLECTNTTHTGLVITIGSAPTRYGTYSAEGTTSAWTVTHGATAESLNSMVSLGSLAYGEYIGAWVSAESTGDAVECSLSIDLKYED